MKPRDRLATHKASSKKQGSMQDSQLDMKASQRKRWASFLRYCDHRPFTRRKMTVMRVTTRVGQSRSCWPCIWTTSNRFEPDSPIIWLTFNVTISYPSILQLLIPDPSNREKVLCGQGYGAHYLLLSPAVYFVHLAASSLPLRTSSKL
jgi:hypothetical protein